MATIFFGIDNNNSVIRQEINLSENNVARILSYLMSTSYGQVTENVQTETKDPSWSPDENQSEADRPVILTQQWVTRPATQEEMIESYAKMIINSLVEQTVAWEKAQAAANAISAVEPISTLS